MVLLYIAKFIKQFLPYSFHTVLFLYCNHLHHIYHLSCVFLKVIEEEDDPHKIEHLLISITGYDAAVLDSFAKLVQTAAKMTNVDVTKRYEISTSWYILSHCKLWPVTQSQIFKNPIFQELTGLLMRSCLPGWPAFFQCKTTGYPISCII